MKKIVVKERSTLIIIIMCIGVMYLMLTIFIAWTKDWEPRVFTGFYKCGQDLRL